MGEWENGHCRCVGGSCGAESRPGVGAGDRVDRQREPAEACAGRGGRRSRLRAPVRRGRGGLGRRRAAARLRLRALAGRRRTIRFGASRSLRTLAIRSGSSARSSRTPTTAACRASRGWSTRCSPATRWRASSPRPRSSGRRRACSIWKPKSVMKRMKDKAFARAVSRDDLPARCRGTGPAARRSTSPTSSGSCGRRRTRSGCGEALSRTGDTGEFRQVPNFAVRRALIRPRHGRDGYPDAPRRPLTRGRVARRGERRLRAPTGRCATSRRRSARGPSACSGRTAPARAR